MMMHNVAVLNAYGLVAARGGKYEETRRALDLVEKRMARPDQPQMQHGMMTSAAPADRQTAEIMKQQLQAEVWIGEGRRAEALNLLARTASEEDALTFEFGPPMPMKPAHELYAEELLAANRPAEARDQFERALERDPKRAQSLRGLANAAAAAGNTDLSKNTTEDLKSFWHGAK